MPEQENKSGISDGNQSGVRTENIQQNQSKPEQTERVSDDTENARSEPEQVFNAKGAATYLSKDEKTIRNRIRDGRIKAEKIGGTWRITKAALDEAFVNEHRDRERKTEQENIDVRSTESPKKKERGSNSEQETEQENTGPTDYRSDVRIQALEEQNENLERIITEKEKRITEKEKRLDEKDTHIEDLRKERERTQKHYDEMVKSAQRAIKNLNDQVAQLEAPKQPINSNFEAVEVDSEPKQEEPEQGSEEPKKKAHWWQRSKN